MSQMQRDEDLMEICWSITQARKINGQIPYAWPGSSFYYLGERLVAVQGCQLIGGW